VKFSPFAFIVLANYTPSPSLSSSSSFQHS